MNLFLRQLWLTAYCTFNKILRQGVSHPRINYLYEKYYPVYAGILPWTSGIPPWRDEMKDVPAWYKRNEKFMRKWLCSSDLAYCPVPFVISPRLSYKHSFTWMFKTYISMANSFEKYWQFETTFKNETTKNQFSNLNLDLT